MTEKVLGTITLTNAEIIGLAHNRIANTIKDYGLYADPIYELVKEQGKLTIKIIVNDPSFRIEQAGLL